MLREGLPYGPDIVPLEDIFQEATAEIRISSLYRREEERITHGAKGNE
jgi:hypothetical protein